jgi:hypothetical protein
MKISVLFRGIPDNEEIPGELFTIDSSRWESFKKINWRKPVIMLPNYKKPINILKIFQNCEVISINDQRSLDRNNTVNLILKCIEAQKSQLDENYY